LNEQVTKKEQINEKRFYDVTVGTVEVKLCDIEVNDMKDAEDV
jgi:hypothetical protein